MVLHLCDDSVCYDDTAQCFGKCSGCCNGWKAYDFQLRTWADGGANGSAKSIHLCYMKHCRDYHGYVDIKSHEGNGKPSGAFAFTLTASPNDGLSEDDMITAVRKVMSQKSNPVKKYAWYLEYKNPELKTHPHIHGMYETETGGVIEKKHWKRAWKIWDPTQRLGAGFRGGYHRPVSYDEKYANYIAKQNILGDTNIDADPPPPPSSPVEGSP